VVLDCQLVRYVFVVRGGREIIFLIPGSDFYGKRSSFSFVKVALVAFNNHVTDDVVVGWRYILLQFDEKIDVGCLFAWPDLGVQRFLGKGRVWQKITVNAIFVGLYSKLNVISDTHN